MSDETTADLTADQLWAQETAPAATTAPGSDDAPAPIETTTSAPAPAPVAVEAPAPDPIQQALAALQASNAQLQREFGEALKTVTGRVGALQSKLDKGLAVPQPSTQEVAKALKSPEAFNQLLTQFPEIAAPIQALVEANLQQAPQAPAVDPAALQAQIQADFDARLAATLQRREELRVERAFPGWKQTIASPEFNAWRATQPAEVNALAASDLADDAIAMLAQYKKSVTSVADINARRQAVAGAARTSKPAGAAGGVVKSEDQMTDAEFFAHVAAQRMRSTA